MYSLFLFIFFIFLPLAITHQINANRLTRNGVIKTLGEYHGATALQVPVSRGYADVVNVLLRYGANPNIKNDFGKSPLDYCEAFPELRGAMRRISYQQKTRASKGVSLNRRDSTASDLKYPMYLISLKQLQNLYGTYFFLL